MKLLVLALALLVSGCASLPDRTSAEKAATSPTTFAVCKTVDIGSTALLLHTGHFVEANPLVAGILSHGYFPLIALSVGVYELLVHLNNPTVTLAVNAVTCGVAAHNLLML